MGTPEDRRHFLATSIRSMGPAAAASFARGRQFCRPPRGFQFLQGFQLGLLVVFHGLPFHDDVRASRPT